MATLQFFSNQDYNRSLNFSSPTKLIAEKRNKVYEGVMANFYAVRDRAKQLGLFDSASVDMQDSMLGVTLKEASMKAYLSSFAGYIAIERSLSQVTELITYKDYITKGTGAVALPLIGKQNPRSTAESRLTSALVGSNTIQLGGAVVPGSIMIVATKAAGADPVTIIDDRKGVLLAQGGILKTGSTINYNTGELKIELGDVTYVNANITFTSDHLVDTSEKRIKARQGHFLIRAKVNKFEYEYDLIMDAITNKTIETSMLADITQAVRDEHQESINNALTHAIMDNYAGTNLTIDVSTFSVQAGMFDSVIRVFKSGLASVDTALAKHTYKAVTATAYLVSPRLGDVFQSMDADADWVPNNTGFVNGLLGFYKNRAVLRHVDLPDGNPDITGVGYAIHKTANGELAPTALGILLPATDLPMVGNFKVTNEIAGGIYAVEGADLLTNDLVQKFTIKLPNDWNIVK